MKLQDILVLKKKFEVLGFDIKDVELIENANARTNIFQMSINLPISDPLIKANSFAALFTVRVPEGQKPMLDNIHAAFLNSGAASIVDKTYTNSMGSLPTKTEMFRDLSQLLQIKEIQKSPSTNQAENIISRKNKL